MSEREHPLRAGPAAFARVRALAERDGVSLKEATERLILGAHHKGVSAEASEAVDLEVLRRGGVSRGEATSSMVLRAHRRLVALDRYAVTSCTHDECAGEKKCKLKQPKLWDESMDKKEDDF